MKQYSENNRGNIDEVARNKHLPRRQHAEKPILKYDGSKPVQYFSQSGGPNWDHRSQPGSGTVTPTRQAAPSGLVPAGCISPPRMARNGSSGSLHSSRGSPCAVDFSCPLSAKEVVRDFSPSHRHRQFPFYRGGAGVPHNTARKSLVDSAAADSGVVPSSLQLCTFLQPSASVYYDSISTKMTPQIREASMVSHSAGDLMESAGPAKDRGQCSPGKAPGPKTPARVGGPSDAFTKTAAQSHLCGAASADCSLPAGVGLPAGAKDPGTRERLPVSSGPRPVNASQGHAHSARVNDTDGDFSSGHFVHSSENIGSTKTARSDTTGRGVKPLSGSASFNSAQSHADGAKAGLGRLATGSRAEPLSGDIMGSMAGVEESGLPLHNLTASSLLNTRMGVLRKTPAGRAVAGTLQFKQRLLEASLRETSLREASLRAGRRAVPILLEQRPRGDGAPTLPVEKSWGPDGEEEDDNASVPSGERLPGDGEASDNDLGNDDDDGIDDLYDDCQEDGSLDGFSVSSSLSRASASSVGLPSAAAASRPCTSQSACGRSTAVGEERVNSNLRPLTSSGELVVQPALRRSLFAAVPPTLQFVSDREKVEQLPWEIRKLLKWRMSPITPNVVKAVLRRSNFRITKKSHDWLGCFGKHMKAAGFKSIREYQKLNHFPGSFQLGRKDRLWRNLSRMQMSFGKKEFGFFPQTYVLPQDVKHLKRTWEDANARQKWIVKPPASARGIGIKVISRWSQIPRKRPVIVQRYLSRPLLINGSKFDMRVYVYVTCFHPLRVYVFEDGLARFASCKYSSSMKNLGNKFMHLTNYSINKRNADYQSNADSGQCQGHKWSLKSLWTYLEKEGVDTQHLWDSIKDMVIKTLISADGPINTMVKANVRSRYTVHELFGFDILLDDALRPWILEVNISPSLHSSSPLDISIKGQLVRDMMNLAGFRVPDKNDVLNGAHNAAAALPELSAHIPPTAHCMDKRLFTNQLSADERAKHAYFCHKSQDEQALQTILDTLTPDDVRVLTESMDEDGRRGGFIRVFPTPHTKRYLRYFQQPRYYNLLLDQWVTRYHRMEQRGIAILQGLCEEGIHLENPTTHPGHQWCPPNSAAALLSARDKNPSPLKKDTLGQKASLSMPRLPKVKTTLGDSSMAASIVGMPPPAPSPPVSRPVRPLDPAR